MNKFRIVREDARFCGNQFIAKVYEEVFWVEELQTKRSLFRSKYTEWVRLSLHLSIAVAENEIKKILAGPRDIIQAEIVKTYEI